MNTFYCGSESGDLLIYLKEIGWEGLFPLNSDTFACLFVIDAAPSPVRELGVSGDFD